MKKARILLIQDNVRSARYLTDVLRQAGYQIDWQASDATLSRLEKPSLIIFDSHLLDDEAFRVVSEFRAKPGWRDLPLLTIATILGPQTRARLRLLNADEVVAKPVDPGELLVKVRAILQMQQYYQKLDAAQVNAEYVSPKVTVADHTAADRTAVDQTGVDRAGAEQSLAALNRIASVHASPQNLETILVNLLCQLRRIMRLDAAFICLEVEPSKYCLVAHIGDTTSEIAGHYRLGESFTGWIAQHKQPLLVNDVNQETRVKLSPLRRDGPQALRSFMGIPLLSAGRAIGTLEVSCYETHVFDPSQMETLYLVAKIALTALTHVRGREGFAWSPTTLWSQEIDESPSDASLLYRSQAMEQLMSVAARIKNSSCPVLITGESGTGKELIARFLHGSRAGSNAPFLDLNCAAVPEALQEAELFGIERGIATGVERRTGRLEASSAGTLFLDEIGYMPLSMQAKLLRVFQERTFERVGGHTKLQLRSRVIAATSLKMQEAMRDGKFLNELYHRLAVIHLHVPPLRERTEDIPLLVRHFLRLASVQFGRPLPEIPDPVMRWFQESEWPGNIRQLRNAVERCVLLSVGSELQVYDNDGMTGKAEMPPSHESHLLEAALRERWTIPQIEQKYSRFVYQQLGRNKTKACEQLKINYRTLCNHLKATDPGHVDGSPNSSYSHL